VRGLRESSGAVAIYVPKRWSRLLDVKEGMHDNRAWLLREKEVLVII
jgi:hypothetical protein